MNVRNSISHEQAMELLPWLVNDSLESQEKDAVLEHAHSCVMCRRELNNLKIIQGSISQSSAAVPQPDMRKINARIDEIIERQNRWRDMLSRLRNLFDSPWRIAFAAQSVILIVLATLLFLPRPEDAEFATLTQTERLPAGQYVRVVFSPDIEQSQLNAILHRHDLTIVNGPSLRGVYTLEVAASIVDAAVFASRLQDDSDVLFAQSIIVGADR